MPSDQHYGETRPSHELTLSNLRALEESLRTMLSEGNIPSIYSVTSTCFSAPSALGNKVLLPLPSLQTRSLHCGPSPAIISFNNLHQYTNNALCPLYFPLHRTLEIHDSHKVEGHLSPDQMELEHLDRARGYGGSPRGYHL